MIPTEPLVSIVTPVLNAKRFIAGCLESVVTQSYSRVEHVLVDGGSTDGTLDIIRDYASRYPERVRYISEPDCGCGDASNKGMKFGRGDLLCCLGGDDLCEPGAVEAVVEFFRSHPDASFVHGACRRLNEDGSVVIHQPEPFDFREFVNTARHIATPSAYFKREVLEQIGWLDSSGDDFDVMLRIAQIVPIHHIEPILSTLRVYRGSMFNPKEPKKRKAAILDTYRISRRYGGSRLSIIALHYYFAVIAAILPFWEDAPPVRWVARQVRRLMLAK